MSERLVAGLTGTFGSGKSSAGRLFKKWGARRVIDADKIAHEPFQPGHPLAGRIRKLFGSLDRKVIAREVFGDPRKRKRLEAILHPYVRERVRAQLKGIRSGIVILEVPLLFETGFDRFCDMTVAVAAGRSRIEKRLQRKGFSRSQVRARMRAQWPEEEKKRKSDLFIRNSGSKKELAQKTKLIWAALTSQLKRR